MRVQEVMEGGRRGRRGGRKDGREPPDAACLLVCFPKEQIKLTLWEGLSAGEAADVSPCAVIPPCTYLFSSNMNTPRQMGQDYKYTGKEEEVEEARGVGTRGRGRHAGQSQAGEN